MPMHGVPPELMAALQGQGGASAPQGQRGIPPELMAALAGGGAPEGPPPSMSGDSGQPGGSDGFIRDAIDVLSQAVAAEADEQDIQTIQSCITNLQGVLANNQKNADSALQGKASPRAMRMMAAQQGQG